MGSLVDKKCIPCSGGVPALNAEQITALRPQLHEKWVVVEGKRLRREYRFDDFKTGLAFVNEVGAIAEAEDHHPDIFLAWGRVAVTIFTHAIGGLSESDFILAAKIDNL